MPEEAAPMTYRSVLLEIRANHAAAFFWHILVQKDAAFGLHEEA